MTHSSLYTPVLRAGIAATVALALAGCASTSGPSREDTMKVIRSSFQAQGIAKLDRLDQSPLQMACSAASERGEPLPESERNRLQAIALETVKYPADGKYLGDWKAGEKIAQTGVGLQFSDKPDTVNGGNCYACHQLSPKEIAFGNLGPSLTRWGKDRGTTEVMLKYTWGKLWNTHAYNACSQMPRFGEAGILTEAQLRDVMALLFDPASPVNQ